MDIVNIVLEIVETAKYPLLFLVFLIEGPVAGFIASISSAAGNLNIWIVFVLFVVAEIGADVFYYYLGKKMSESKLGKWLNKVDNAFLDEINRAAREKLFKVMFILKFTGVVAIPGLIYLGNSKVAEDRKVWLYATILCLIKDIMIVTTGYFTGIRLSRFIEIYNIYKIAGLVLLVGAILYLIARAYDKQIKEFIRNIIKNKI